MALAQREKKHLQTDAQYLKESTKKSHFLQSAFLNVRYIGLRSNSIFI